jgi:DNA modification methylase
MPYKDLEEFQGNLKTITQENANKLKKEILELGWTAPVFVWNKKILDGHGRLFVLKQLDAEGYEIPEIPVIEIYAKDEHEAGRILLGINSNFQSITNEGFLDFIETYNIDFPDLENIVLPDIDMKTIEQEMLGDKQGLIEDDDIPEVTESKVKPGDIWQLGNHRIMCGDSTKENDVEKLMNGKKADMVFTDPPYGVDYEGGHNKEKRNGIKNDKLEGDNLSNLFKNSIITSLLFTKDTCPFYIWYASGKSVETFKGLSETGINVRAIICWYKVKSGLGSFMAQYIPNYEPCIYGHKEGKSIKWYGETDEKTVWELPNDNKNKLHPTQKPIILGERAIKNSSKRNNIILDMFLGSGSTLIACEKTNRICYGMELDTNYCNVIITRWEEYTGKKAELLMNINT